MFLKIGNALNDLAYSIINIEVIVPKHVSPRYSIYQRLIKFPRLSLRQFDLFLHYFRPIYYLRPKAQVSHLDSA